MTQEKIEIQVGATDSTARGIDSAVRNLDRLDKASRTSTRQMRAHFSQLGYQIQDISVQLQGGQNALMVLGQQGSQIASVFGMWGSIAGAAIAALAAIIYGATKDTEAAKTATDLYTESLDKLKKITEETKDGQVILAEQIAKTAEVSAAAAKVQLEVALREFEKFKGAAATRISELFDDTDINAYGLDGLFDNLFGNALNASVGLPAFEKQLEQTAKTAGVAEEDLEEFLVSYRNLFKDPTTGSFQAFADAASNLALQTKDTGLDKIALEAASIAVEMKGAAPGIKEVEEALVNLQEKLDKRVSVINAKEIERELKDAQKSFAVFDDVMEASFNDIEKLSAAKTKKIDGLWKSVATPMEAYNMRLKEIAELHEELNLPGNLRDRLEEKAWDDLQKALEKAEDKYDSIFKSLKDSMDGWRKEFTDALIDSSNSFDDFVDNLLKGFAKIATQKLVTDPLFDFFESAMGNILPSFFSADGRALGGPVDSGRIYEVNETGTPELLNIGARQYLMMGQESGYVSPISKSPSRLDAVQSMNSQGMSSSNGGVIVNINEDSSKAGQVDRRSDHDNTIIDVFVESIKRSISNDLSTGRGSVPSTLQSVYGLSRTPGAY